MTENTVEFELVAPEKLLLSKPVEMVVVPGEDGDFGVLPRHSLLLSNVRPGVIRVYQDGAVIESIFVAGGFAEVTPERCTVLAEEALPLDEIDRAAVEQSLKDLRDDLVDAGSEEAKAVVAGKIAVDEAKLAAIAG